MMMTSLLVYGYCVGVASSRKIEKSTHEGVAFRVIAGGEHPDHTRISEFRRVHLKDLADLFVQVLAAMSYDRMEKDAARLRQKVRDLLAAAEATDAQEDAEYGKGRSGDELPEELRRAETRLARPSSTSP